MFSPPESVDFAEAPRWVVRARAVCDATGRRFEPGQVVIEALADGAGRGPTMRTVAVGVPGPAKGARELDLPRAVILPGFVNAHTHLDLTLVGPQVKPETGGFSAWLRVVRDRRPQHASDIRAAVQRGVVLSRAGGVVAVGDIGGSVRTGPTLEPWRALRESGMAGVSFLEFFAIGSGRGPGLARLERVLEEAGADRFMLGLQPHAPYSVSISAYEAALDVAERLELPLATHLAETLDERQFIASASGPQRTFLDHIGLWSEEEMEHIGRGRHPVEHLDAVLRRRPWVLAHVNDCSDDALERLAASGCSVVYCPRAAAYFGVESELGAHRYRAMLDAGVNVCLGTDSIVNLPPATAEPEVGITPLDDARLLYRRDRVEPGLLLDMLTTRGARALGLDETQFVFNPGSGLAGLVAVETEGGTDGLMAVFGGAGRPKLLA